jgi:DNA transposition AAA+ family ATPase
VPNAELVKRVRDFQRSEGLSDAGLARVSGVSSTAISQYFRGRYMGSPENVEIAFEKALAQAKVSRSLARPTYRFVETEIHRRTMAYMKWAKALNHCCVLAGPAGIGKTRTAMQFQRDVPNVVYRRVSAHCGRGNALISALKPFVWASRRGTKRRFIDDFYAAIAERDITLVLDQAHQLRDSGLEVVFDIYDLTGQAIIMIANEKILRRIRGDEDDEQDIRDHDTDARRVKMKPPYEACYDENDRVVVSERQRPAHWYSLGEIAEFVGQFPLDADEEFLLACRKIADGAGHLGSLDVRLNLCLQFTNMKPKRALREAERYAFQMRPG